MKMAPGMPELLVRLHGLKLLIFQLAADTTARQIPLRPRVVGEQPLPGHLVKGKRLAANLPVPDMISGGVVANQQEYRRGPYSVLDQRTIHEIIPVIRLDAGTRSHADDP